MKRFLLFIFVLCLLLPADIDAETFGYSGTGGVGLDIEDKVGGVRDSPSSNGMLDSIRAYLTITGTGASFNVKCAVHSYHNSNPDTAFMVDTSEIKSVGVTAGSWIVFDLKLDAQIYSDSTYIIVAWANTDGGDHTCLLDFKLTGGSLYWAYDNSETYGAWPSQNTGYTDAYTRPVKIEAYYTPAAGDEGPVRCVQGPGGSRFIQSISGASEVQGP